MANSRCIAKMTVPALLLCLVGCGGGNSLTGGSVPIGGRAITATAVLPNGMPVANAVVTVKTLSSGTVLQTTTTNAQGQFTTSSVPVTSDLDVIVTPATYVYPATGDPLRQHHRACQPAV